MSGRGARLAATSLACVLVTCGLVACGDDGGGSGRDDAGGGGGGGSGRTAAHAACLTETNRYRAMTGKSALAYSAALEAYADEGAMHDFATSPHDHFSSTQGGGIAFAENECPQQGNWQLPPGGDMATLVGQCIAAFYAEGPGGGHYENMMGAYATLGCGIYQSGSRVTIVQDFGH